MANIKVTGDAMVIASNIDMKDLTLLAKHNPEALILTKPLANDEREPIFAICLGDSPTFSRNGIQFTSANDEGKAQMTMMLPMGLTKPQKEDFIRNAFSNGIIRLNALEDLIAESVAQVQADFDRAMSTVTIE